MPTPGRLWVGGGDAKKYIAIRVFMEIFGILPVLCCRVCF